MFNSLLVLENYVWFSKFLLKSFNNLDLGKRSLAPLPLKLDPKLSLYKNMGLVLPPPSPFRTKSENINFFLWLPLDGDIRMAQSRLIWASIPCPGWSAETV